jgi:Tol biopolymer transport system component
MKKILLLLGLTLLVFWSGSAVGQFYFGKNKVQYTQFDWRVLKTEHFEVYFYQEEEELAQLGARVAEEAYLDLRQKFNHEIFKSIPFIIYSSPHYFEQTNVVPNLLPENVAGFTEFIKGRMVIPFDGSYAAFARVIKHELVHVFTFEKLTYNHSKHRKLDYSPLPLWFSEGIAEFWSGDWDSQADMIMRDLVISGQLVSLDNIFSIYGSFLMYKEGESFCHFLAETYGEEKLTRIFDDYWRGRDFEQVVAQVLGKPLELLDKEWQLYLKQKYYPDLQGKEFLSRKASKLTREGFNVSPTWLPISKLGKTENCIAFKTNRRGYSTICLMPESGERGKLKTLVKGERSASFESLHLLKSKISANRSGQIAFASKSQEKDFLYIYDTRQNEIIKYYGFENLVGISSPTWSPNSDRICFAGVTKSGFSDLYVVDLKTEELIQITDNLYQEKDPAWSPVKDEIAFASDQGEKGKEGALNLFKLDLPTKQIAQLTYGLAKDQTPSWSPDGKEIIFSSDRDKTYNLYLLDSLGQLQQLTHFVTGCFDPQFKPDQRGIIFSGFENYSFQIYSLNLDSTKAEGVPLAQKDDPKESWKPEGLLLPSSQGSLRYQNRFSFDIAQSAVAYDAFFGVGGGFQGAVSDVLGNRQYIFLLSNSAETKEDFLTSFNFAVTYIDRIKRLNHGYGFYHFYERYLDEVNGDFRERQYGGAVFASYPFSKFQRIETSFFLRSSDRNWLYSSKDRKAILATNYLSWIKDTSLWDFTGPLEGTRFNLTFGLTYGLDKVKTYNRILSADVREYFRLGNNSCLAARIVGYASDGSEPQRLYLGGSWSLRGFDRKAFLGKHLALANLELRFPLIDDLYVGFPIGKFGFQAIRGALFTDAGKAWDDEMGRLYGSLGFGARISLGYFTVLRFDWAWTHNFHKINSGPNFDFFFGWNF